MIDVENILIELKKRAAAAVAQYPQYKGHFDKYVLVQIKNKVVGRKAGIAFNKGDFAIANPELHYPEGGPHHNELFLTVWSEIRTVNFSVNVKDIRLTF